MKSIVRIVLLTGLIAAIAWPPGQSPGSQTAAASPTVKQPAAIALHVTMPRVAITLQPCVAMCTACHLEQDQALAPTPAAATPGRPNSRIAGRLINTPYDHGLIGKELRLHPRPSWRA
jgi:cytochrome c553